MFRWDFGDQKVTVTTYASILIDVKSFYNHQISGVTSQSSPHKQHKGKRPKEGACLCVSPFYKK